MTMAAAPRFPLMPTVRDAYRDVFGDVKAFFRMAWLMWVLLLLCVELPSWFLADRIAGEIGNAPVAALEDQIKAIKNADTPAAAIPPLSAPADSTGAAPAPEAPRQGGIKIGIASQLMAMGVNFVQMLILLVFTCGWFRALLLHERRGQTLPFHIGRPAWDLSITYMKAFAVTVPLAMICTMTILDSKMTGTPLTLLDLAICLATFTGFLYLQARFSLSYPITATGQGETPLKDSWKMTRRLGWRILAGNMLVTLPTLGALFMLAYLLVTLVGLVFPLSPPGAEGQGPGVMPGMTPGMMIVQIIMKLVGSYALLLFFGVLSAFHARVYATLVRNAAPAA